MSATSVRRNNGLKLTAQGCDEMGAEAPRLSAVLVRLLKDAALDGLSRNALLAALVGVGLVAACRKSTATAASWSIESYQNGVLRVSHEGRTYEATCETSRSFNNSQSDPRNIVIHQACELPVDLVGQTVQGFGGNVRDDSGNVVVMWSVGSTLALRRSRDERSPWRMDEFRITSVAAKN